MKFKTFTQLHAERAARRARPKRMRLSKIIKELNKENAPPDGWKPEDKVQAPSVKQLRLTSDKLIRYYKRHRDVN